MIIDPTISLEDLAELKRLRALFERAARQFTVLDEGVHSGSLRPHPTLVRIRDAANDEVALAWAQLKAWEKRNPEAVRVLDQLEKATEVPA